MVANRAFLQQKWRKRHGQTVQSASRLIPPTTSQSAEDTLTWTTRECGRARRGAATLYARAANGCAVISFYRPRTPTLRPNRNGPAANVTSRTGGVQCQNAEGMKAPFSSETDGRWCAVIDLGWRGLTTGMPPRAAASVNSAESQRHSPDFISAGGGTRTRTALSSQGILSPQCLPVPPPRHARQV